MRRAAAGLIAGITGGLLAAHAALAQQAAPLPPMISIPWVVTSSADPLVDAPFAKNSRVEIGKAAPLEPLRLTRQIAGRGKRETIPAGATFAPANAAKNVICETERRLKMSSIRCLADSDSDGAFDKIAVTAKDSSGYSSSTSYGYIIGFFPIEEWEDVRTAIPRESFQPATDLEPIKFELVIYSEETFLNQLIFNLCAPRVEGRSILGFPNKPDYCFGEIRIPISKLPRAERFVGGILGVSAYDKEAGAGTMSYSGMKAGMRL